MAAAARTSPALRIDGFTPLSSTDYPDALSAIVFCQGCPWRCGYCHNPHLLPATAGGALAWTDIVAFLERRRGLLDAVVFSGGEPLAQAALGAAMREAKGLGFRIGLHTGGAYPERLADVLSLVDWIGFDVKAPFAEYAAVTGAPRSGESARRSAQLVVESGVACEFRTTLHPALHTAAAVDRLAEEVCALGGRHYVLQAFRSTGCADAALCADDRPAITAALRTRLAPRFATLRVRA